MGFLPAKYSLSHCLIFVSRATRPGSPRRRGSGGAEHCPEVRYRAASLRLPGGLDEVTESTCQSLMTGLMVYFAQLHDEYPDNIEVLEDD